MNFGLPRVLAVVSLAGMLALPALALDSDREQPIILDADDFEIDLASGTRTYRGSVVFRRGSIHLECDELVTYHNENGDMDKGVCSGTPGEFRQRPEGRDSDMLGRALSITFDQINGVVILDGRAEVDLGGDRIQGRLIKYDIETRKATVTSVAETGSETGDAENDRPRLIIPPKENTPNKNHERQKHDSLNQ